MAYRDRFSPPVRRLLAEDQWLLAEDGYDPIQNLVYETNFCLASGKMGHRGVHEEGFVRNTLPASYVHGVFDRSEAFQRELANTPDWAKLKLYYQREPLGVETGVLEDYLRVLDMQNGLLAKRYVTTSEDGRKTQIEIVKFLSRRSPRCGLFRVYLTPLNYSGLMEAENIIDATVTNFMDFPRFRVKHLSTLHIDSLEEKGCYIQSETRDFHLPIGTGTAVRVLDAQGQDRLRSRSFRPYGEIACEFIDFEVQEGETTVLEKYAAVCTGRDFPDVRHGVLQELEAVMASGFDAELSAHTSLYHSLWDRADFVISGDDRLQHALRFNLFHLMSTPDREDSRVNIGAKLIHGEEYGGHAFWDNELFIRPFFDYVFPQVARNMVEYRYHLLDKALDNAEKNGYQGAQYPWESADTGDEECPAWTIEPDGTCYRCYVADYEHHVTAAVAFGAMQYFRVTEDHDYFEHKGLEILTQTARFWASRLEYNCSKDRYEIHKVTGPDEWHEPVDNNAYTNHLAYWNIQTALSFLQRYQAEKPEVYERICRKTGISQPELEEWRDKADKIYRKNTTGLIEQFDGYFQLADAEIDAWDENNMPLLPERLKKVLKGERCILKQADVVMLQFLLQYEFDLETQRENFEYYETRTLHRSSLSPCIHCIMGLRVGDSGRAYDYLERSAYVDIHNNQNNTREGIHAASAGGTWQCVALGYCGMSVDDQGQLVFQPRLPEHWTYAQFTIQRQGALLRIRVTGEDVEILQEGGQKPILYFVNGVEKLATRKEI